ncbi:hypothetical protein BU26DRAFT_185774 [Trematosphaeria pertusa]|uniref:Uncharacterized protein n=1 Tax=Trematosphaeria pertusa TaxID=390896 RepID=A0A6A6HSM4_9PLEO|nr:uncharacterized protein BU26DRAFT_185774 [Trematosphaeria pertusa]KAF2240997.1 hypothetical protein BU26DRAFT_185774 [Trematosphaeria pertusa]
MSFSNLRIVRSSAVWLLPFACCWWTSFAHSGHRSGAHNFFSSWAVALPSLAFGILNFLLFLSPPFLSTMTEVVFGSYGAVGGGAGLKRSVDICVTRGEVVCTLFCDDDSDGDRMGGRISDGIGLTDVLRRREVNDMALMLNGDGDGAEGRVSVRIGLPVVLRLMASAPPLLPAHDGDDGYLRRRRRRPWLLRGRCAVPPRMRRGRARWLRGCWRWLRAP